MAEQEKTEELEDLLPGTVYTLESGKEVIVTPVGFGQIRRFSEAVTSLAVKAQTVQGLNVQNLDSLAILLDVAFEEVVGLMALVLEKEGKWFDRITVGDGVGLLVLVLQQNWTEQTRKNVESLVAVFKEISTTATPTSVKS